MHSRVGASTKQEGKMVIRMSEVSELLPTFENTVQVHLLSQHPLHSLCHTSK